MIRHMKPLPGEEPVVAEARGIISKDKTFYRLPEKNFLTLSEAWRRLAIEEVGS